MLRVAIVGAGELGGAVAQTLATRDLASAIHLIDPEQTVAAGKALDIMQAAPIQSFSARVSGSEDLFTAGGAHVVVLADRAGARSVEWQTDAGLDTLGVLTRITPDSVFLCAGALQRELVERGVRTGLMARARLFGTASEALAAAVRSLVALEADVSATRVSLTVLGIPPSHTVVPWDQANIDGLAVTSLLSEPVLNRLKARVVPLWPPGPLGLASAAAEAIASLSGRSRRVISCFVAPDEGAAERSRVVALPARLGWNGVVAAAVPALNAHDQVALDNARLL